jgi:hypothetical protein
MLKPLKASFLQLPVSKALERAENGGAAIAELWMLFYSRSELEEKSIIYSLKAARNNYQHEIPNSTSSRALG